MATIDFDGVDAWFRAEVQRLRAEARALGKRRRRRRRRPPAPPPHAMLRRSQVRGALERPGPLDQAVRFLLASEHGISRCSACGETKDEKCFPLRQNRAPFTTVGARCIACLRMPGYKEDPLGWFANHLVSEARSRAEAIGVAHDIDAEWVRARFERLGGACELCGRPMTLLRAEARAGERRFLRHPANLSLDQRVPKGGYTRENVQLVNVQCNLAKLDLSQQEFLEMCRSVTEFQKII